MKRVILVDFENVHTEGIKNINLLLPGDYVYIFYSANASYVSFGVTDICNIRANVECNKLTDTTKNALDFQLSSYLGFLIRGTVLARGLDTTQFYIVSNDAGFDAVLNFWTKSEFAGKLNGIPEILRVKSVSAILSMSTTTKVLKSVDQIISEVKTDAEFSKLLSKNYGIEFGEKFYLSNKERFAEANKECSAETHAVIAATHAVVKQENIPVAQAGVRQEDVDKIMAQAETLTQFNNMLVAKYGNELGGKLYRENKKQYLAKLVKSEEQCLTKAAKPHERIEKLMSKAKTRADFIDALNENYGISQGARLYAENKQRFEDSKAGVIAEFAGKASSAEEFNILLRAEFGGSFGNDLYTHNYAQFYGSEQTLIDGFVKTSATLITLRNKLRKEYGAEKGNALYWKNKEQWISMTTQEQKPSQ
ncbi:hypothetical protein FACS1894188_06990 [Clostridia bacterium]|nr:hypothetical protein FACS1894188_06990 [Clostridia bacterium]